MLGIDLLRTRTSINVLVMESVVNACSILTEWIVKCGCGDCSDRVRRILMCQMMFIHFFDANSGEKMIERDLEIVLKDGPDVLPITEWADNPLSYTLRLVQDPKGVDALCSYASQFPGNIRKVCDVPPFVV